MVHPVARPAFAGTVKADALDFKIFADQLVQIDISRDDVATDERGRTVLQFERAAELIENLEREKRDLPFVVFAVIEEAITADTVTGHAFHFGNFDDGIIVRCTAVMAEEIVPV